MKLLILKFISIAIVSLILMGSSFISIDSIKVEADYDGFDEEVGYIFSFTSDDEFESIIFEEVKEDYIKKFNLQEETSIGKRFEVTYTVVEIKNEDDFTFKYVLKSLKQIK